MAGCLAITPALVQIVDSHYKLIKQFEAPHNANRLQWKTFVD